MNKQIETNTCQDKQKLAAKSNRHQKRNRFAALMGCMVVLTTAIALMVPSIGITEEAGDVPRVVMDKQLVTADEAVSAEADSVEAASEEPAYKEAFESKGETELTAETALPGGAGAYEVKVAYGPDANIPDGATLDIKAIDESSTEYEAAKEEIISAKKAEDKNFIESAFRMVALDITILDADGNAVEPAEGAKVNVSITMNALPEGASEEAASNSMEVQHLNKSNGDTVVETVAGVADVDVAEGSVSAEFAVDSFSVFALTWTDGSATIHYGVIENGAFKEFAEDKVALLDTTASSVSLDNNFDGYTFIAAYYAETEGFDSDSIKIEQNLQKIDENAGWEMTQHIIDAQEQETIQKATVAPGSRIYAIYGEKGGPVDPSGEDDPDIPSPITTKNVSSNNDGTYTIQLDVEPTTISEESSKTANVLIILDRTTSMNTTMSGGSTRWTAAKTAINTLVDTITTGKNAGNAGKIDWCLVGFGGYYNNYNDKETLVDWTKSETGFKNEVNELDTVSSSRHGTNWEGGMDQGQDALRSVPDTDPTYVIFITDGNPNCTDTTQFTGMTGMNSDLAAYEAADEARAIASTNSLYGVFCGASTTSEEFIRLNNIITGIIDGQSQGGVKTIAATDEDTLKTEFATIAQTIVDNLGASNVSVDDGVTQLSSVSSQFAGKPGGYKYYISYKLTVNGDFGTYKDSEGTEQTVLCPMRTSGQRKTVGKPFITTRPHGRTLLAQHIAMTTE